MMRIMYRAKIHRATVTKKLLHYEGSIGISTDLLEAADIIPGEKVQVLNFSNGARFETYAIPEKEAGVIAFYGPAAHLGEVGDLIMVISYALAEDKEAKNMKPKVVYVDEKNRIKK